MIIKNVDSLADIHSNSIFHGGHLGFWKFLNIFFWTTELILFGTPHCTKISKKVSGYQPFLGTPGFQPDYYKEVKEKPTKKIKGGQKLTWHHTIERDFKKNWPHSGTGNTNLKKQRKIQGGGGPHNGRGSSKTISWGWRPVRVSPRAKLAKAA